MQSGSDKAGRRLHLDFILALLLIALLFGIGWMGFESYQSKRDAALEKQGKIANLRSVAQAALVSRKWNEAHEAYGRIQEIEPGSLIASKGFELIRKGKLEEKNQQIFYLMAGSQAALEAGHWDEARQLARSVLVLDASHELATQQLELIEREKHQQDIAIKTEAVSAALETGDPESAQISLEELRKLDPQNPSIPDFANRVNVELEIIRQRRQQAQSQYQQAMALDTGEYSPRAIELLEEALRLHPESQKIQQLHSKMGTYARALRVPGDYASIAEAIEAARPRDIIRVAAGTYRSPVIITKPIKLEGDVQGGSIIELPAREASMITVTAAAPGTRISGFKLRHNGFDYGAQRYSAITIEAVDFSVSTCEIENAGGHGIAILDGAQGEISGCKITRCGWDGISIYGKKSIAEISDTVCMENLQQGIGFWGGGSGRVTQSKTIKNGLCGILAMSRGCTVTLHANTSSSNREAGILLSDGVVAELKSNLCEKNLLSGIVARGKDTSLKIIGNTTRDNLEVGILIHKGARAAEFQNNQSSGNKRRQIQVDQP